MKKKILIIVVLFICLIFHNFVYAVETETYYYKDSSGNVYSFKISYEPGQPQDFDKYPPGLTVKVKDTGETLSYTYAPTTNCFQLYGYEGKISNSIQTNYDINKIIDEVNSGKWGAMLIDDDVPTGGNGRNNNANTSKRW